MNNNIDNEGRNHKEISKKIKFKNDNNILYERRITDNESLLNDNNNSKNKKIILSEEKKIKYNNKIYEDKYTNNSKKNYNSKENLNLTEDNKNILNENNHIKNKGNEDSNNYMFYKNDNLTIFPDINNNKKKINNDNILYSKNNNSSLLGNGNTTKKDSNNSGNKNLFDEDKNKISKDTQTQTNNLNDHKNENENISENDSMEKDEEDISIDEKKNKNYNDILQKLNINKKIDLNYLIKNSFLFLNKNKNDNLNEKLVYILDMNKYLEEEIKLNKDNNLLTPKEAVFYIENIIIRFLGYFGGELCVRGINTYIEKVPTNELLRNIIFKILASGLATQKNYTLVIENEKMKSKFKKNNDEWLYFLDKIKLKISEEFDIDEKDIYFFGYKKDKLEVNLVIYNKRINGLESFLKKLDLKVSIFTLMNYVILSPCIFDKNYCKDEKKWTKKNLVRGGKQYQPPYGWYGISLRLKNKYGKTDNNTWLGKKNKEGEWPVAYHGIQKGKLNIFDKILNIMNGDLNEEIGNKYKNFKNVEKNVNKYPYCGEGILLFPNIEDAEKYADKTSLGYFHLKFQFVFMTRININKIRSPKGLPIKWILNGNSDEIRPYRLLIKIV